MEENVIRFEITGEKDKKSREKIDTDARYDADGRWLCLLLEEDSRRVTGGEREIKQIWNR